MNVLYFDPWGINETAEYTNSVCIGLSEIEEVKLTVASNYYFVPKDGTNLNIEKCFFKHSENMKNSFFRKIIRGFEYYLGWRKILRLIKKKNIEVVHINWLLFYAIDIAFLKKISKKVKVIYTAHNVLPHINGTKYIPNLRKIYGLVNRVVLHGEEIKKEFLLYFGEYENKIYIQQYGCNYNRDNDYDIENVDRDLIDKIGKYDLAFLYIGAIFYNKGVDRLFEIWKNNKELSSVLLIVAGKENFDNSEYCNNYTQLKKNVSCNENVIIMDWFVSNNDANFLFNSCDLVILPYRHASMSGVIYTAVDFSKSVLATKVGSINDYLSGIDGSFLVDNNDKDLEKEILALSNLSKGDFRELGKTYTNTMREKYSWSKIIRKLFNDCYK